MFKKFINFSSHNWWAIIYFNFKMLPFKQAIKLPFDFKGKVRLKNLDGRLKIATPRVYRGMIKFGFQGSDMFPLLCTTIDLKGEIFFSDKVSIGAGCLIRVEKNGMVLLNSNVVIGAKSVLFSEEKN